MLLPKAHLHMWIFAVSVNECVSETNLEEIGELNLHILECG